MQRYRALIASVEHTQQQQQQQRHFNNNNNNDKYKELAQLILAKYDGSINGNKFKGMYQIGQTKVSLYLNY